MTFEVWLTSPEGEDLNMWTYDNRAAAIERHNTLTVEHLESGSDNAIEIYADGALIEV